MFCKLKLILCISNSGCFHDKCPLVQKFYPFCTNIWAKCLFLDAWQVYHTWIFFVLYLSESCCIWGCFYFNKHYIEHISESSSIKLSLFDRHLVLINFPRYKLDRFALFIVQRTLIHVCIFNFHKSYLKEKYTRLVYLQWNVHCNTKATGNDHEYRFPLVTLME